MWSAVLLLALLLLSRPVSAFQVYLESDELQMDVLVAQEEITTGGMALLSLRITIPTRNAPGIPDRVAIRSNWRWLAQYPKTTVGDRVGWLRIDGRFVGAMVLADSCPGCLWQSSGTAPYTATLLPGPHTIDIVFGGCCGIYGHAFIVGAGSRLEALW